MKRSQRHRRTHLITGIISAGVLALAGCSASSTASGASGKVTLVVYSAQGYDHAMVAAFQKATGIPVKLDDNSTGPLLTQIEASKNNPN
jgi:iron(III) transport system substrate-binding protein